MYNVRLSPCGANGDQKAAECNRGLGGRMVSVKCGFRLEYFSTLMFFLTNIVAAFYLVQQKTHPNEAGALKNVSRLPGQRPHPKYYPPNCFYSGPNFPYTCIP